MSFKYLLPSEIHYLVRVREVKGLRPRLHSINLTDYAFRLTEAGAVYPTIQVVEHAGRYYTLNNLNLALCRRLEKTGLCRQVRVEVCPARMVPQELLDEVITTATIEADSQSESPSESHSSEERTDEGVACLSNSMSTDQKVDTSRSQDPYDDDEETWKPRKITTKVHVETEERLTSL